MEFSRFKLFPAEGRLVMPAEQRVVGDVIEAESVLDRLPKGSEVLVEIGRLIAGGATLAAAHGEWLDSYFPNVETPPSLPRQPIESKTPCDLVHVTVSVINTRTQGMGSHFGFDGYFLSLLISLSERTIWDARGQRAK